MQIIADSHTVTVTVRPSSQKENPFRWATFCVRRRLQKPQGVHLEGRAWQIQLTWMHWPRPITPLTVCKRILKKSKTSSSLELTRSRVCPHSWRPVCRPCRPQCSRQDNGRTLVPWRCHGNQRLRAEEEEEMYRWIQSWELHLWVCAAYQDNKDSHCGSWARRVCDCLRWAPCSRHSSPAASASRQSPDAGGRYLHAAA